MERYVGKYTLKLFDNSNDRIYKLPIMEHGKLKEKVNLETIDRFINMSYFDDNSYESFSSSVDLKEFIERYYGINISNNFDIKITYKKPETKIINGHKVKVMTDASLDVIYHQSKTIKYFSHVFAYYKEISDNSKKKKEKLKENEVWKAFWRNFEHLISNSLFFEFIKTDKEYLEYISPKMREHIENYYYNCYNGDRDSGYAKMNAREELEKKYYSSYKSIRGMQLVIDKYNRCKGSFNKEDVMQYIRVTENKTSELDYQEWVNKKEGLSDNYLNQELFNIDKNMPVSEMKQSRIKKIEEDMVDDYDPYQNKNYEIPEDMAMTIGQVVDKAELAEALFAEGYSLEDILNDPELARILGYPEQGRHR